eukprot:SAG11_NODE_12818_length_682_cov_1.315068_1_plen_33_part_10
MSAPAPAPAPSAREQLVEKFIEAALQKGFLDAA